jgi:hypothetical protein
MRRITLAAAVLGAAFMATPAPAATMKVVTSLSFDANYYNPNTNSGFNIMGCGEYREETVGGSTIVSAYCNVNVYGGTSSAGGSGQLTLDFDPGLLTGTISGTLGSVVVNLTFLASEVSTNPPPYAGLEVVPTSPQQGNAQAARAQRGRVNGTVSSPPDGITVNVVNGGGNAYRYLALLASA